MVRILAGAATAVLMVGWLWLALTWATYDPPGADIVLLDATAPLSGAAGPRLSNTGCLDVWMFEQWGAGVGRF